MMQNRGFYGLGSPAKPETLTALEGQCRQGCCREVDTGTTCVEN